MPAPKPEKSTLVVEEQEITNDEEPTFLALSDEDDDSSINVDGTLGGQESG